MSRLLFAAARGARIQRLWFKMKDEPYNWEQAHCVTIAPESDYDWRIHPEYGHLQYGGISTALREIATTGNWSDTVYALMAKELLLYEMSIQIVGYEIDTIATFALILSEALADEGL